MRQRRQETAGKLDTSRRFQGYAGADIDDSRIRAWSFLLVLVLRLLRIRACILIFLT